jgi:hypothetical protein
VLVLVSKLHSPALTVTWDIPKQPSNDRRITTPLLLEVCPLNSETHYNRIYMCLYGKQVNFCLLSVKAVRGSYTPSL